MVFRCEFEVGDKNSKGYWRCDKRTINMYCSEHRCKYTSPHNFVCGQRVMADGSNHCNNHNCHAPQCDLMIKSCTYIDRYCQEHSCIIKYCSDMKLSDESNCGRHHCVWSTCCNIVKNPTNGKPLCEDHCCQTTGCNGLPTNRIDMLCKYHKKT